MKYKIKEILISNASNYLKFDKNILYLEFYDKTFNDIIEDISDLYTPIIEDIKEMQLFVSNLKTEELDISVYTKVDLNNRLQSLLKKLEG